MSFNKTKSLQSAAKLAQQGKHKAAIEEYREVLRKDPDDTATMNVLGDLYMKVGNNAEAVRLFVRVADKFTQEDAAPKAIAMLRKAGKLAPENTDVGIKLAALYFQQNLLVEAQQQYLAVADQYMQQGRKDEAFAFYRNLVNSDPDNLSLQITVADACMKAEMSDKACEMYLAVADRLQEQLKHEEALKTYLKALAAKPEDRRALTAAINVYLRRAETRPAETLLRQMLKNNPDDQVLLNLLSRVHQVGNDLELARQAISSTDEPVAEYLQYQMELVSSCGRAYATFFTAASELERQGQDEEALQSYLKALRIKPESRPATIAAVNLYLRRNDLPAALKLVRHLLQILPDDAEALSLMGRVYCEMRDFDAALQPIGRAVAIEPNRFRELLDLASFLGRRGEVELAFRALDYVTEIVHRRNEERLFIPILQELLQRDPEHLGLLERLADVYTRTGQQEPLCDTLLALAQAALRKSDQTRAMQALKKHVALDPEAPLPRQLLERLSAQSEADSPMEPMVSDREESPVGLIVPITDTDTVPVSIAEEIVPDAAVPEFTAELAAEVAAAAVAYFPNYNRYNSLPGAAFIPQTEAQNQADASATIPCTITETPADTEEHEADQTQQESVKVSVGEEFSETPAVEDMPEAFLSAEFLPASTDSETNLAAAEAITPVTEKDLTEPLSSQCQKETAASRSETDYTELSFADLSLAAEDAATVSQESTQRLSADLSFPAEMTEPIFSVPAESLPTEPTRPAEDTAKLSLSDVAPVATDKEQEPVAPVAAISSPALPGVPPSVFYQVVLVNFDCRPSSSTHWRRPRRTHTGRKKEITESGAPPPPSRKPSGWARKGRRPLR